MDDKCLMVLRAQETLEKLNELHVELNSAMDGLREARRRIEEDGYESEQVERYCYFLGQLAMVGRMLESFAGWYS